MDDEVKKELNEGVKTKERDCRLTLSLEVEYNDVSQDSVESYMDMALGSLEKLIPDDKSLNRLVKDGVSVSHSMNDKYGNLVCTTKLEVTVPDNKKPE